MMKKKVYCILGLLIYIFAACETSKIKFLKEPVLVQNPNTSVPLTCYIDFQTKKEYEKVVFNIKDSEREFELEYTPSEKGALGYLIFLMRPEQENKIAIELTDLNNNKHQIEKELIFKTPGLPEGDMEIPGIEITKLKTEIQKEELTLFNPRRRIPINLPNSNKLNQSFGMLAITNLKGEILWYYRTDSRISDFDLLPNGNLSFMTQDSRLVEIDFAGNIINQWYAANRPEGKMKGAIAVDALTFHHDVSLLPNGNRLVCSTEIKEIDNYYTSERDRNATRKRQKVMGDVIIEFTPEGKIVHRWSSFDHMPVMRIGYETFSNYWIRRGFPGVIDWSHANAVVPVPNENAYLINYRYQSAMIKVNKTKGEIEWIFAEPSGWGVDLKNKLLQIPEDGWNWHQHSPRYTANGNLLFFNNNNYKARPFNETALLLDCPSYVVEYKINEKDKTVKRIWDSLNDHIQPVVSIAMGRVSELPNGNILACYGALLSPGHMDEMTWWNRGRFPQWTMVREHTHTAPSNIVWEMRILPRTPESKVGWTLFGADRIELKNLK
jgi:hypothetical protein